VLFVSELLNVYTLTHAIPQNFSGGALTNGYTTYFLQLAGLTNAFQGTVILYSIEIVALIAAVYMVEKVGRRPLVLIGTAGCGICMLLIGALANVKVTTASSSGLIVICSAWELFYGSSLSPIGWIFIAEVSTLALKAKTTAFAVIVQSLSGLLFSYTVPLMLSNQDANWGERTGFLFAGTCFIWLIVAYFYLPDTKGRNFADLDDPFERKIPLRKFHKTKTTAQEQMEGLVTAA
jgi:MFS family permease